LAQDLPSGLVWFARLRLRGIRLAGGWPYQLYRHASQRLPGVQVARQGRWIARCLRLGPPPAGPANGIDIVPSDHSLHLPDGNRSPLRGEGHGRHFFVFLEVPEEAARKRIPQVPAALAPNAGEDSPVGGERQHRFLANPCPLKRQIRAGLAGGDVPNRDPVRTGFALAGILECTEDNPATVGRHGQLELPRDIRNGPFTQPVGFHVPELGPLACKESKDAPIRHKEGGTALVVVASE